jgi:hypothetical protein
MSGDENSITAENGVLWNWIDMPGPSDLSLRDGESVAETWLCNHAANRRIARGGRLYLTDRRLAFRPHALDTRLGANSLDIWRGDIQRVTVEPGDSLRTVITRPLDSLLAGGLRSRLRVETEQRTERFMMSDPDAVSRAVETTHATSDGSGVTG